MREILLGCASCLLQSCVTDHGRTRKSHRGMQEQALRNVPNQGIPCCYYLQVRPQPSNHGRCFWSQLRPQVLNGNTYDTSPVAIALLNLLFSGRFELFVPLARSFACAGACCR